MNISILQWNVWYKEDIENIVKELKRIDADVVCLQELTTGYPPQSHDNTIAYVAESLGYNVYASEPMKRDDVAYTQFNAIFSRYPIIDRHQAWINTPIGEGGPSDEYRAYLEAAISVDNVPFYIATTHMSYVYKFEMTPRKKQETDLLISNLTKQSNYVLCGDFNATPESYTFRELEKRLHNVGPTLNQKSWTTKPFKHDSFVETDLAWRLDYMFSTKDIKTTSAEIIHTDFSDHLPILATFKVNG